MRAYLFVVFCVYSFGVSADLMDVSDWRSAANNTGYFFAGNTAIDGVGFESVFDMSPTSYRLAQYRLSLFLDDLAEIETSDSFNQHWIPSALHFEPMNVGSYLTRDSNSRPAWLQTNFTWNLDAAGAEDSLLPVAIPEPSPIILLALGVLGLLLARVNLNLAA